MDFSINNKKEQDDHIGFSVYVQKRPLGYIIIQKENIFHIVSTFWFEKNMFRELKMASKTGDNHLRRRYTHILVCLVWNKNLLTLKPQKAKPYTSWNRLQMF